MIAYIVRTCAKGILYNRRRVVQRLPGISPEPGFRCPSPARTQQAAQRQPVDDRGRDGGWDGPPELQTQHHQASERQENEQPARMNSHGQRPRYFSRTRVPRIFWLLSALRKLGTSRSMSSKYEDSAGVFCCAL